MRRPADVEVWGTFSIVKERVRGGAVATVRHLGNASTIRGVRAIAKRHPTAIRLVLKGTADQLDRANGYSLTWARDVDLVSRYVPVDYEIVKETTDAA